MNIAKIYSYLQNKFGELVFILLLHAEKTVATRASSFHMRETCVSTFYRRN